MRRDQQFRQGTVQEMHVSALAWLEGNQLVWAILEGPMMLGPTVHLALV